MQKSCEDDLSTPQENPANAKPEKVPEELIQRVVRLRIETGRPVRRSLTIS